DDLAHAALHKLGALAQTQAVPVERIAPADIDRAGEILERILASRRKELSSAEASVRAGQHEAAVERFRADMTFAVAKENDRRDGLVTARAGAQLLRKRAPGSHLANVLRHIARADEALHDPSHDSFLS